MLSGLREPRGNWAETETRQLQEVGPVPPLRSSISVEVDPEQTVKMQEANSTLVRVLSFYSPDTRFRAG